MRKVIGRSQQVSLCSIALVLSSFGLGYAPAFAQTPQDGADANIADIVVTANKREQKLNDVGLTVAVVSGDALKNQQINSLADLAQTIPSLSFTNTSSNTPVYTLRGVGFYETSIGSYPTVSVYSDEVPLPFPVLASHSAYDLERVEVLKGPQGTLFGQNATGGAINYVAAKPTDIFHAGADLSYGRFNEVIGEGYVSGPLSDTLKARLSGRVERADGWQISNSRPNDRNGKVENYMGRLQVAFEPSDGARFLLNINGWKDKSQTAAAQYIGLTPQNPILDPGVAAATFSPLTARAADWTPGFPFADNRMWQSSLRGDIDVTDAITLTSLTAYVDYKQRQGTDGDGLPTRDVDLVRDRGTIKSFSQELRLSNGSHQALRWVVGVNYEHSKIDQIVDLDISATSSNATLGAVLGYPIRSATYSALQRMTNYASFANVEYDISHTLTLKAGARYTNAKTSVDSCNRDLSGDAKGTGPFFYDVLLGGAFGPYQTGDCFAVNLLSHAVGNVAPGSPGNYVDTLHEDNVSWRVGVDWKPRPGVLLYGNVAKGYKAGSFPTVSAFEFTQYLPVKQESVLAYEAGFKASLLDRALQFNGAAFYYDYRNKQLRSKEDAGPFGILDVLQNIPKSTIKGFELEIVARPISSLTVSSTFTYLDAKIDRFAGINAGGVPANFAGVAVPYTPKYQIGTNVDYEFPISDAVNGFLGASLTYRSSTVSVIGGNLNPSTLTASAVGAAPLFRINDYALVDLRAGVESPDGRWRFSFWGKNVLNKYYWNNVVADFDTVVRYANKPATYGASVAFKY
ncbi:TonB-dependent receptor [Sphingobium sp. CECT 9361]|uniref:TonB-dependent receptor n=1 Tax=Sphingobium sp. CECT 9361 TaxID=2845384 RepID=UPI001E320C1B|nr:TonB-dependent receptor [Sphingobium sp. CECT 9361]CAH0357250.1 Vitamin B12 transporter BtuB [Sphingobium sp. CECT 9361]